jgi:hypothetical protein
VADFPGKLQPIRRLRRYFSPPNLHDLSQVIFNSYIIIYHKNIGAACYSSLAATSGPSFLLTSGKNRWTIANRIWVKRVILYENTNRSNGTGCGPVTPENNETFQ